MRKMGVICLVLLIVWTGFVFSRSMKSGEESSMESGRIMAIVEQVFGFFGLDAPSEHTVRKLGHFGEYAILGALGGLSALGFGLSAREALTLLYTLVVALLDEFVLQRLSEGRGPSMADVGIDLAGAAFALLLLFAVLYIKKRKKEEKISQKA